MAMLKRLYLAIMLALGFGGPACGVLDLDGKGSDKQDFTWTNFDGTYIGDVDVTVTFGNETDTAVYEDAEWIVNQVGLGLSWLGVQGWVNGDVIVFSSEIERSVWGDKDHPYVKVTYSGSGNEDTAEIQMDVEYILEGGAHTGGGRYFYVFKDFQRVTYFPQ